MDVWKLIQVVLGSIHLDHFVIYRENVFPVFGCKSLNNSLHLTIHKKRKDSLETRAEPVVLCIYVENQVILEPILLYRASKCKQTKRQGNEDCLWTDIFTFLCDYYKFFFFFLPKSKYNRIKLCYNRLQFVKETQISSASNHSHKKRKDSCAEYKHKVPDTSDSNQNLETICNSKLKFAELKDFFIKRVQKN